MAEAIELVVALEDPRERLDRFVVARLRREGRVVSRAAVQRWIEHGRVTVQGGAVRASASVPVGAHVVVEPEPPEATTATPDASIELCVVHEDEHLIVIDKPAGLVVHPARGHAGGTLVNALLGRGGFERAPADEGDPEGHLRPGIVHRLDKGTSGLLVVAKDEATREALKALFSRHEIEREYVAIVAGTARDATYDTLHGRDPADRKRFTTRVRAGKRAVTHVRLLERLGPASVVACTLETGRTHQIRVHLREHAKTPILADPVYGPAGTLPPLLRHVSVELGRQALHARVLGFVHPATGVALRWESALPADLRRALEELCAATRSST